MLIKRLKKLQVFEHNNEMLRTKKKLEIFSQLYKDDTVFSGIMRKAIAPQFSSNLFLNSQKLNALYDENRDSFVAHQRT